MKTFSRILIPALALSFGICAIAFANTETKLGFQNGSSNVTKLTASDGATNDNFGESAAIDGDFAVVGAYNDDDNGNSSGSVYFFKLDNGTWSEQAKITPNDGAAGEYFGNASSIDGNYAIIGAYRDDDNGSNSGSAYIFFYDGTNWTQQAKLLASDGAADDRFGCSVSISGDFVIVGASRNDANGADSGSAYIFKRNGTSWTQQVKLVSNDIAIGDEFGYSVSISGNFAVIGAYLDDDNSSNSGSAYIFSYDGSNWSQHTKLTANDGAEDDYFGNETSINGNYAIIGAFGDDDVGSFSGSAYIFFYDGSNWSQQIKLTPDIDIDGDADNEFGFTVDLDGDYAIVGSLGENFYYGSAYIYKRNGVLWDLQDKIIPSDGGVKNIFFGYRVGISGDNVIVAAERDNVNGSGSGSAYIYNRNVDKWQPEDTGISAEDYFGSDVAVDGNYAIVGAVGDNFYAQSSGSAYIFFYDGSNWSQQAKLTPNDGAYGDSFGGSVSISGDYVLIGAKYDEDNGSESGSAYVFKRSGTSWSQEAKLTPNDGASSDIFGQGLSIDGNYAVIGAHEDDDNVTNSGSAYIFFNDGTSWSQQAKLTASDGGFGDNFGISTSISGDYVIVGSQNNDDNGSAYVFFRNGTSWSQQAKLTASDGDENDRFGESVSIDGDYTIIGAHNNDDDGSNSGSAYIFKRSGTSWNQETKLTASDAVVNGNFGYAVSINEENVIIGAFGDDDNGSFSGSAYTFNRDGSTWSERTKLKASNGNASEYFGLSVAINGAFAICGASENDEFGTDAGRAYAYLTSFNNGNVTQTVSGDGTQSFNDGTGEDTGLDIDFTGVSNSADIQCQSFSETPATTDGISGTVQPIRWEITDGGLAFTNAEIRIDMTTLPITISNPGDAVIYHRSTPGSGSFTALATTVDGNELVGNTGSFSEFAIGGGDAPLSVELDSFTARQIENTVQLTWSTASETDNEGFNVYRKTGEKDYIQIASFRTHEELLGQGNTTANTNYTFVDDSELKVNKTYTYYVSDVEFNGLETKHEDLEQSVTFGVESEVVRKFELAQNFPNPFNPTTTLQFQVAKDSRVSLKIYNLLGKEIRTLVNEVKVAGNYNIEWNGLNNQNIPVSTGVYFAKIQAGSFSKIVKMSLIK